MISVVICSVSPERLRQTVENINDTIGVEHEIIPFDNRDKKWPIAKVYNHCASKARFGNLLFVHEDVQFYTHNWGGIICQKLSEPDCGVIGFAGSRFKTMAYSGWNTGMVDYEISDYRYLESVTGREALCQRGEFIDGYGQVICVDGFAMFVSKEVWEKHPFDESVLKGFHSYDIDFSLVISKSRKNYVCGLIDVLHKSNGNFGPEWVRDTVRMHKEKWYDILPLYVGNLDRKTVNEGERFAMYFFTKSMYYAGLRKREIVCTVCSYRYMPALFKIWIVVKFFNYVRLCRRRRRMNREI